MSALSDQEILAEISSGGITIREFDESCLRPSSYLLRLAPEILVRSGEPRVIDTKLTDTCDLYRNVVIEEDGYPLRPNVLHLARSVESLSLGPGVCGDLSLLSCYARVGVMLNLGSNQVAATFGRDNPSVLAFEIVNLSPDTIIIYPGVKICHVRFCRHGSPAAVPYRGIYASGKKLLPANFSAKPAG